MSKYDTDNVFIFDREVLTDLITDQYLTKLDMQQFCTTDYSLAENAGMKKKINRYFGTGDVETLGTGEGNETFIGSYVETEEYDVKTVQGRYEFYDETLMSDPTSIDSLAKRLATQMTNNLTKEVVAEFNKASNVIYDFDFSYPAICAARAAFPGEDKDGLFLLVNTKDGANLQITLEASLKYVESYVRSGYIGTICGVSVYTSDAIPQGKCFLATKEAVVNFVKKGIELETERDANTRKNTAYARNVKVVALVNDDKAMKLCTKDDPREGYTALTVQPDDWATKWNDYYKYDHVLETMSSVGGDAAPDFVAGKYFSKDE